MKKIDKLFLSIMLLIGLSLSVCLFSEYYPIPYVNDWLLYCKNMFPWIDYILAGYMAFVSICLIILLLIVIFFPRQSDFVIIKKSKGQLQFSKRTVESTIKYSFVDIDGIVEAKIKLKLRKKTEKSKVFVKLSLNRTDELALLTEKVQDQIMASLQSSLGVTIKSVTIRVVEGRSDSLNQKDDTNEDASESRRLL